MLRPIVVYVRRSELLVRHPDARVLLPCGVVTSACTSNRSVAGAIVDTITCCDTYWVVLDYLVLTYRYPHGAPTSGYVPKYVVLCEWCDM